MELTVHDIDLSFSVNHPERHPGEVWVQNVYLDINDFESEFYEPYYDLRFGEVAYSDKGAALTSRKPVFGKRKS